MSQLTILSDDQYNGLIDAISSGGGGGGGGSTADITAELEAIKNAIAAQSNIVASNMHIQYITSGTLDAGTSTQMSTTTIHCDFERQYTQVPNVSAMITQNTSYFNRILSITRITNITTTGCDILIANPQTVSVDLSVNRKLVVIIEDTSIIQTSGGGSSEIIIDDTERKIGKYYGADLFEKNVHLDSCSMGNHAHSITDIDKIIGYDSFFRNSDSAFNLPYVNSYQINNSVEIAVNKTNIVLAGGLDLGGYEADITIRYTKLVPNVIEQDRERSVMDESDILY